MLQTSSEPRAPAATRKRESFVIIAVPILVFAILAVLITTGRSSGFDRAVLTTVHGALDSGTSAGPAWLREAGRDVTALGSTTVLAFISLVAVGTLLLARRWSLASMLAGAVIGGQALSSSLKLLFHRARPDLLGAPQVFTASFPSGHALMSAVVYCTLTLLLVRSEARRSVRVLLAVAATVLVVAIGVSRVYLGVHYPTDVLAGWCVAAVVEISVWQVAGFVKRRSDRPPSRPRRPHHEHPTA